MARCGPTRDRVAAAAIYAARAGQGLHLDIYRLSDQRYWLVGARAGVVLSRTDRLFVDDQAARGQRLQCAVGAGEDFAHVVVIADDAEFDGGHDVVADRRAGAAGLAVCVAQTFRVAWCANTN